MLSLNSFVIMKLYSKIKIAAGGHLDFDKDRNVSRINGNPSLNKMTPD
jgi:hypothetical protein